MEIAKHYELHSIDEKIDTSCCTYMEQMMCRIIDMRDKAIIDAVIEFAKNEGITDLYLIDSEFVKTALKREIVRRKENGRCCIHCGAKIYGGTNDEP